MKRFYRINTVSGLIIFIIATSIYWICMEPTLSFWDCGEFISAAFKLQVGHQPGAPLFLMIGKLFSLLAGGDTQKVAYWVNFVSVISSAATVMFLFWTINAIALKIIKKDEHELGHTEILTIVASGAVGALAYTFSDTFWFSAVEAEVYAISSLCTAIVFWAILKWESQLNDKWLLFIAFVIGLSTGMHLLSLLVFPAISLVYYFRKNQKTTLIGTTMAFIVGCLLLGVVQFGILQYFTLFAAKSDLLFVNSFGFDFGTGGLIFVVVFFALLSFAIYYSIQKRKYYLNLGLLSLLFVLFGFSSYLMIIIRANAKPNINLSNPDTPMSLLGYLSRQQYGDKPLIYGQFFNATPIETKSTGIQYRRGEKKYEVSGTTFKHVYDKNTFLPRMYSDKPEHIKFYQNWMNLSESDTPSFWQNLAFLNSYQIGFMYWRYFGWNFIGRQNDQQGQGSLHEGNWVSGIKPIDAVRLGNQSQLPLSTTENAGQNIFYGLPLILGVLGIIYLYRKNRNDAIVVTSLFFCTGIAIIFYINQDPLQVRERDYAYVGSFYAFAIVIGLGVLAVKDAFGKFLSNRLSLTFATMVCLLAAPCLMAIEGWDDHNRSGKTTALEMAKNYLNSCEPNAILFTNADNDTYPLWYAQEVEGIRTDVRVVCLQFLSSDSYIDQMKKQQDQSSPLPITLTQEQYKEGVRDYMPYVDYGITDSVELKDLLAVLTSDNKADKIEMADGSFENFLPSKKLKLSVNTRQVLATNTVAEKDQHKITEQIQWEIGKKYIFKNELTMLNIIANNNWKRPIYFSAGVSNDTYIGLDKYLYLEGFAYRLLPLKPSQEENFDKSNQTNSQLAYQHFLKFELAGFKTAKFLDPESRRVAYSTWNLANTLASNLILEKQKNLAKNVVDKSLRELPLANSSITDTLHKISLVQNLYQLKNLALGNKISKETSNYVSQELDYVLSLEPQQQKLMLGTIRTGFYVMQNLNALAKHFKQVHINKEVENKLEIYEEQFAKNFG